MLSEQLSEIEAEGDGGGPGRRGAADPDAGPPCRARPTASGLTREVFCRSFADRRAIAGFVGLTGTPFNSGGSEREQGISKNGNPRVRRILLQLAWRWLRFQPDSALSCWFVERTGGAKGRIRKIMVVALARKLLVALWRYVETGEVPAGARLATA
jgi:transposase